MRWQASRGVFTPLDSARPGSAWWKASTRCSCVMRGRLAFSSTRRPLAEPSRCDFIPVFTIASAAPDPARMSPGQHSWPAVRLACHATGEHMRD